MSTDIRWESRELTLRAREPWLRQHPPTYERWDDGPLAACDRDAEERARSLVREWAPWLVLP